MTEPYDGWLHRKLAQSPIELRRSWTVSKSWKRITGGRIMFAELVLSAAPSESFSFVERIYWPSDDPQFPKCVLDGILDSVLVDLRCTPASVSFTLEAIKWHEKHSVPHAYYRAARDAAGEIFANDERLSLSSFRHHRIAFETILRLAMERAHARLSP